jgi:uncharacterized protein (DUF2252 family)
MSIVGQGPQASGADRVAMLVPSQDAERGRAARREVPRELHGEWAPVAGRADPVATLEAQARTRDPALIPIRYGRMLAAPFAFYRGAAAVMAGDLAGSPTSGVVVQVCGDAHIANFGGFAAPDRHLLFGLNDFDETLPGPWEWDVKRMAASIEIAGRDIGLPGGKRRTIVEAAIREYRESIREFASQTVLGTWYKRLEADEVTARFGTRLDAGGRQLLLHTFDKGRRKTSARAVSRFTERVGGRLRFVSVPPLLTPLREFPSSAGDTQEYLQGLFENYLAGLYPERRYLAEAFSIVDVARKVVGVGSVGTSAWVCLLVAAGGRDAIILQAKEAQASVLEPYLGRSQYSSHAERVVRGQRMMQAAPDIFLSWQHVTDLSGTTRDFYIRQLWDWKASADISRMTRAGLRTYARACAWSLARSHARSGDRHAVAAYLGKGAAFDRAIVRFASRYADQNERDFRRLSEAVEAGEIAALTGV